MTDSPADAAVRERALDINGSFIIQAPAGSGKTGLLSQRYLALLAEVEAPEEIVAITFTRKAATEMRTRIIAALRSARDGLVACNAHERRTQDLASAALERNARLGWCILENPARLRIMTFDSLCAGLIRQMPVLSCFGAAPTVTEVARPLYLEAAAQTLLYIEDDTVLGRAVTRLLLHLDNRHGRLQELIADMLARRDQWLRHLAGDDDRRRRAQLESVLREIVRQGLATARMAMQSSPCETLLDLLRKAAEQVDEGHELALCRNLDALPGEDIADLPRWRAISAWLLTKEGQWRRSFNRHQGFPPKSSACTPEHRLRLEKQKARMFELVEELHEHEDLREALARIASLPALRYDDAEWAILDALFTVLIHAVAELSLIFQRTGEVDFAEIAMRAVAALGEPDAPTDLALRLDYCIRHLLVDEFQDTSIQQFELLRRLTAGWMPGDGRTLFLVGDPMQSIYRFREAEVGLFIEVKRQGLGDIRPEFLQLEVNFRSEAGIVDWINASFPHVFPDEDDERVGAVGYSPSIAYHAAGPDQAVHILPFVEGEEADEARAIVEIVRERRKADPDGSIAILVRSRSHLSATVRVLRDAGLRYEAIDIVPLAHRPAVQDLIALCRALLHLADRIAWLSVLRSPLCGLERGDLLVLAADTEAILLERLQDDALQPALTDAGRTIVRRITPILATAVAERDRLLLRDSIEQTWLALGGPASLERPSDLDDVRSCLDLIEELDARGEPVEAGRLAEAIERLYAHPDADDARIQLMTIHKAKGLEFDTVIVPALGRAPRSDEGQLLYWQEVPCADGSELLFGPIQAAGEAAGPTVNYIRELNRARDRHESQRLLYVAATRARRRLYLSGHASQKSNGDLTPRKGSLLAWLWPIAETTFRARHEAEPAIEVTGASERSDRREVPQQTLRRLSPAWRCPPPPPAIAVAAEPPPANRTQAVAYDWAGETARHIGTVVHRYLEYLSRLDEDGRNGFHADRVRAAISIQLLEAGVTDAMIDAATDLVVEAIGGMLADPRGRWILSGHRSARSEYPLSGHIDGQPRHCIIDRTFVDDDGTRWIIDYKTSRHEGAGREAFLDSEVERHRQQLETYGRLIAKHTVATIRLGLYFPLLKAWREWSFDPGAVSTTPPPTRTPQA